MLRIRHTLTASALALCIAPSALAYDEDRDTVQDAFDVFPCDPAVAGTAYVPGQGQHGLLVFEDQWPSKGDLDFNDAVVSYNYIFQTNAAGEVVRIRANFNAMALGGIFDNGLALHVPVPKSAVRSVVIEASGTTTALTPRTADAELVVDLGANMRTLFFGGEAGQINSDETQGKLTGRPIEVRIDLSTPQALDPQGAPYDLFIFRSADPTHQIHRPEFGGTANMNTALFGTADDGSSASRHFVDVDGLPYALLIPEQVGWPKEGTPVDALYPDILSFAASAGATHQDYYKSVVNSASAWGLGAPAAGFVGSPDELPQDTTCTTMWVGNGQYGTVQDEFPGDMVKDAAGNVIISGSTRGTFPGQTSQGDYDWFVQKRDVNGNVLWTTQLGSSGPDYQRGVLVDAAGDIYAVGGIEGAFGTTPAPASGGRHGLIVKLSAAGAILWTHVEQSPWNSYFQLTQAANGDIIVSGVNDTLDTNFEDILGQLLRITPQGATVWHRTYQTGSAPTWWGTVFHGVAESATGDLWVAGFTYHYFKDPATNAYDWQNASEGQLLLRLDGSGNVLGQFDLQTSTDVLYNTDVINTRGGSVRIDSAGDIYVGGHLRSSSNNTFHGQTNQKDDVMLSKYNAQGQLLWLRLFGSSDNDSGTDIDLDTAGNVYLAGQTRGTVTGFTNAGSWDSYMIRTDAQGAITWHLQDGTSGSDSARGVVASTPVGEVLFCGGSNAAYAGATVGGHDFWLERRDAVDGSLR